jgi:hypothetical protein
MSAFLPMDIRGNFFNDIAELCSNRLLAAGYALPIGATPKDFVLLYLNVQKRLIGTKPRNIHIAPTINVPVEYKDGFELVCNKAKNGFPLRPHQSDKLLKAGYKDALLNDWGIQHLHLGVTAGSRKSGFVEGTERLLYAIVTDEDFYCIAIMGHDDFSRKELLETVHKNWPELLQHARLHCVLTGSNYSDADITALRNSGISAFVKMADGTVYSSPGGGYSTDRTSTYVVLRMQQLAHQCRAWMDATIENIPTLTDAYTKRWIFLTPPFHFQLKILEERAFAFEKNSGTYLDLKTPILIPPLI